MNELKQAILTLQSDWCISRSEAEGWIEDARQELIADGSLVTDQAVAEVAEELCRIWYERYGGEEN